MLLLFFAFYRARDLFAQTLVHAFLKACRLIFGRHHDTQNKIEKYRCTHAQYGKKKPHETYCSHIPTEELGNACTNTGNLSVCRTNQSLHCKLLFRKDQEQDQIKQCSNTCEQGSYKPRNAHKLYIQTKEFCNTSTNATNHTVICRTKQFLHFSKIINVYFLFVGGKNTKKTQQEC